MSIKNLNLYHENLFCLYIPIYARMFSLFSPNIDFLFSSSSSNYEDTQKNRKFQFSIQLIGNYNILMPYQVTLTHSNI
ncbi:hypothetical protein BpHYR1_032298 [Brachionus plicatilis]|uniref:Uncharacterized protein n=1 Tax=Brachionus plicatilis TaxID=10195 RepID=A0A3M7Q6K3_BRAPC|nr:hypothetical protein BpHYR1_032298 [Brachionus plicatilis]